MRHGLKRLTVAQRTTKIREEADSAMLRMKTLCGWSQEKEDKLEKAQLLKALEACDKSGYLLIDDKYSEITAPMLIDYNILDVDKEKRREEFLLAHSYDGFTPAEIYEFTGSLILASQGLINSIAPNSAKLSQKGG